MSHLLAPRDLGKVAVVCLVVGGDNALELAAEAELSFLDSLETLTNTPLFGSH